MKDRQIFFGIGVGLLTALLGIAIVFVSQAGWSLLVVGFGLTILAVTYRLHQTSLSRGRLPIPSTVESTAQASEDVQ